MKQRIQYCCEYCDAAFANQEAAEEHEAVSHFMILPEEYITWKRLTKEACDASKAVELVFLRGNKDRLDKIQSIPPNH